MKTGFAIHYPNYKTLKEQLETNGVKAEIIFKTDIKKVKFPCYLVADQELFKEKLIKVTITELEHWKQVNNCIKENIEYNRPEDLQYRTVRTYTELEFDRVRAKLEQTNDLYITGCNYDDEGNFASWRTHYGNINQGEIIKILK